MPAIHSMMKRLGFVRLRDYGLVLTPEGRILSIRPAVLDDGLGGRIVGWKDDDLAAMELDRWSELGRAMAAKPASRPAVATPVAVRPIAPLAPPPTPRAVAAPPIPAAPARPIAPPTAPTRPNPAVVTRSVAPEPVVEEDDWERTIAIARARAAAEEAELAAAAAQRPSQRRMRADTVPPPTRQFDVSDNTKPAVRAITKDSVPSMATKPAIVKPVTVVETPTPLIAKIAAKPAPIPPPLGIPTPVHPLPVVKIPAAVPPNRTFTRGQSPATVIPIPKMPKVEPTHIAPVVARRTQPSPVVPIPPAQPRRFAKGTGPVLPSTASAQRPTTIDDTLPNLSVGDKTVPSMILPRGA